MSKYSTGLNEGLILSFSVDVFLRHYWLNIFKLFMPMFDFYDLTREMEHGCEIG